MPRSTSVFPRASATIVGVLALFVLPAFAVAQSVQETLLLPMDLPLSVSDDIDFGHGIAVDGDTVFVGAPKAGEPGGFQSEGRVYVYQRDGVDWVFLQELSAATPTPDTIRFGHALTADDGVLAVGCHNAVILFREIDGVWTQDAEIALELEDEGFLQHLELALEDDVLAVLDVLSLDEGGSVHVFRETGGAWDLEQVLPPPFFTHETLGVELAQGSLMFGTMELTEFGGTATSRAKLHIYEREAGSWVAGPAMEGGRAIHASGDRMVTQTFYQSVIFGIPMGVTTILGFRVFERRNGQWVEHSTPVFDEVVAYQAAFAGDLLMVVGLNAGDGSSTVARLKTYSLDASEEWIEHESELIKPFIGLPGGGNTGIPPWELVTDGERAVLADASFGGGFPPDGGAFVFRATPFGRLESGELAGTGGVVPQLAGSGALTPGSDNLITLSDALPSSTTALLSGLGLAELPFKGGVLVPTPNLIFNSLLALPVDAAGQRTLSVSWPADVPAGTKLYLQHWVVDPAGPFGYSASNGLELVAQ